MTLDQTQSIRPTALQVDLARRIANEILTEAYKTGTHLSEELLAKQYQVSRTPVRGALKLLASQSLLSYRPNVGYFVCPAPNNAASLELESEGLTSDALYRKIIGDRADRALPESFTDQDLLQRYGVPRSVLAKTLVRLSAEALIEKRKGHGWQFPISLEDSEARAESYRFRAAVESAGFLEPTFQVDPVALDRMRVAHEQLIAAGDALIPAEEFFTVNTSFHETLARFSGNRFVLQTVQQQNLLRRLEKHKSYYRLARFAESLREHMEIIKALEKDDREWAAAIMRHHLASVQRTASA